MIRPENSINWTLQIKYPQVRDSGVYECQINTEPKMSLSYELHVIGEYTTSSERSEVEQVVLSRGCGIYFSGKWTVVWSIVFVCVVEHCGQCLMKKHA